MGTEKVQERNEIGRDRQKERKTDRQLKVVEKTES